ncbi:MAG: hypothetical protein AAGA92_00810 [Planctomycetota bacterium]
MPVAHTSPAVSKVARLVTAAAVLAGVACTAALAPPALGQNAGRFAPGVLEIVPPELDPADTVQTDSLVEILAQPDFRWTPNHSAESRTLLGKAETIRFRRDIWCLEFAFKPMRMIEVDVPQPNGKMRRKLLWYLVYRVRNTGAGLSPSQAEDGTFTTAQKSPGELRFIPQFVLVSHDEDAEGKPLGKEYLDRVVPTAYQPIENREFPGGVLQNSVGMANQVLPIESGRAVGGEWGVAIWEDVDPRIDFFAVYVTGLTNAYRFENPEGAFQPGDAPGTGRTFTRKALQLNFWRPGDDIDEDEREIRFGAPLGRADAYSSDEGVAYRWVYR